MPRLSWPEHALGVLEASEQLLPGRRGQRLPDLARRLALEPAQVRERVADREPDRRLGDVRAQRVVEVEDHCVAQLEDADGRERLRDRPDAIGVLGRRVLAPPDIGRPERRAPHHLAVAKHRRAHGRDPLLRLRGREDPIEGFAQLGHIAR